MFRYSILTLMLSGLLGCASHSDTNYASQASETQSSTIEQVIQKVSVERNLTITEQTEPNYLTDLVNIPELEQYLKVAFENNPSLQQSVLALKIAGAEQGVTGADRLPSVTASFSGENSEANGEQYNADLTASWELDLWQKVADSNSAALKDIAATQANLDSARDLLSASIMRAWLEISVNQQLLEIEQRRLEILDNNESLVLDRYQVGLGSLEELDNAKTSAASTRATVAQYQENLQQSKRGLLLLTGQWSKDTAAPEVSSDFPEVINPLDNLSMQDMSGRPDLRQAFYNIEADTYRSDAAYKAMLPSFSISASLSDLADNPSDALFSDPLWAILGQVSAPLFQGGKLKSEAEVAELTMEQSYWAYQEILLNAVNEVENATGQEYALSLQQQHLSTALTSAKRSVDSYEQKYREGLVDILDLLSVQQQAYDTEAQLVNATYQRLLNRIDLGLALGLGVSA
ncbi:TolC family protein [Vibrio superstes]|uniref:Outer membrane protein OprM n=1 Tax=Vibrio superstes NBRC 103154 TaxID=1219062 RepID=A0A511QQE7_9VIBR|nr:TolC family protein [Vibrio superstes]GEM79558.1 outer membrane protein OprM [Vibrio superstes NBRC 103154]